MDQAPERSGDAGEPRLTVLLNQMRSGDRAAGEAVVALVYDELHRIASREMRRERPGHTLQTTALVHEAYIKLANSRSLEIQNRGHFFAIASQQMRRILVDYARAAHAERRGGDAVKIDLDWVRVGVEERNIDLVLLDESLKELEQVDPRAAQIVELRYFGGYTDKEVVESLGLSLATVRRDWQFARSWLFDRMGGAEGRPAKHSS